MDEIQKYVSEQLIDEKMVERRTLPDGREILIFWVDGEKENAISKMVTNDGGASCVTYHATNESFIFIDINIYIKYPVMAEFMMWHEMGHVFHNHAKRRREMKSNGHDFGPDGSTPVIPEFEREADNFAYDFGRCPVPTLDEVMKVQDYVRRNDKRTQTLEYRNMMRYLYRTRFSM